MVQGGLRAVIAEGVLMTASNVPSYRGFALVLHVQYWIKCIADSSHSESESE